MFQNNPQYLRIYAPCQGEKLKRTRFLTQSETIAAPERTRAIDPSKRDIFERSARVKLVDFSKPMIKQVSDFMDLYHDPKRHHLTNDGYKTALRHFGPGELPYCTKLRSE